MLISNQLLHVMTPREPVISKTIILLRVHLSWFTFNWRGLWQRLPRTSTISRGISVTSQLLFAQSPSKWTDFVFDYFCPNVTAEPNCFRIAIKSSLMYQPYTEWDDFSLITILASLVKTYDSTVSFVVCVWPHEHLSDDAILICAN